MPTVDPVQSGRRSTSTDSQRPHVRVLELLAPVYPEFYNDDLQAVHSDACTSNISESHEILFVASGHARQVRIQWPVIGLERDVACWKDHDESGEDDQACDCVFV